MAIRTQVYGWDAGRSGGPGSPVALPVGAVDDGIGNAGKPISIFIGRYGNNIKNPPYTTATEFVVIDSYGCTSTSFAGTISQADPTKGSTYRGVSPNQTAGSGPISAAGVAAYLQVRINTTGYFEDPDGVPRDGLPGTAIPYPKTNWNCGSIKRIPLEPVYVLPGQNWDIIIKYYNSWAFQNGGGDTSSTANIGELQAFVKYILYDGADAIVAMKLLEMGIDITPNNADWYKKQIITGKKATEMPPDM